VVDVDVPPTAGLLVDDLNLGKPALELLHVPEPPKHALIVLACSGPDNRAVDQQIDARFPRGSAAADQEVDVLPRDRELRRSELALRLVAAEVRVHQPRAKEPGDR
jgi:hypothetical protein